MKRKTITLKINNKEKDFTIRELTVQEIIDITENSVFFNSTEENRKAYEETKEKFAKFKFLGEIATMFFDLEKVIKLSCTNFSLDDLKELTPSQIREIHEVFKEVNSDFLDSLKAIGVLELLKNIKEAVVHRFSRILVTSLSQGM